MKTTGIERQQRGIQGIPIRSRDSTSPYRQIRDYIVGQISSGAWPPGHRLPPLRKWAAETGVAYQTMSHAIRGLVSLGILETRQGSGTRVAIPGRRRDSRVGAVGVVSSSTMSELQRESRFFTPILAMVQDQLTKNHERVIYERWPEDDQTLGMFDYWRLVDGLVVLGSMNVFIGRVKRIQGLGLPVVCVGAAFEDEDLYVVKSDNVEDSRRAVRQLVEMGHRRIAAWAIRNGPRMRGYVQGLRDAGIAVDERYISDEPAAVFAERFADIEPAERPSALFIGMWFSQMNLFLNGLRERGIRPGEDLYICSYDEDLWNNLAPLGIAHTAIQEPVPEIARAAADMLLRIIEGKQEGPRHVLIHSRITVVPARAGVEPHP